jgi:uncharacterized protein YkwD
MSRALSLAAVVVAVSSFLAIATPSQAALKAGAERSIEQNMLTLVNAYRGEHGLAPLQSNGALMRAAREHSRDMVEHGYFDHTSLDGEAFSQRLSRFGFRWTSAGEAIGQASGLSSSTAAASSALTMWRQSPPHNRILLTGSFRSVGIGAWCTDDTGGGSTCTFTLDAARG